MFKNETNQKLFQEQVDNLMNNMNNPFVDLYHWCKGEMYDIQAISDAIVSREGVEKDLKKLETKKKNTQTDLENVNQGKKTVRTIFKNEKNATGM